MVGRPYIATHVDPYQVAPLLARVLPEPSLHELAEAAVRDQPSLMRGMGPHPVAEVLVAQALGGSDTTAGAVLFALQHELRGVMEDLAATAPSQLAEELNVCELMERRQPAHILLALLLDPRSQVNSLGTVLLDEYCKLRENVEEAAPAGEAAEPAPDWVGSVPAGETVLPAEASAGPAVSRLQAELEQMMEENRALLERVAQLEQRINAMMAHPEPASMEAEEIREAPEVEKEPAAATAPAPAETTLEEAMNAIFNAAQDVTVPAPRAREETLAVPDLPHIPPVEEPAPPRTDKILSGEHILLLGGDPRRRKEYEAMLAALGARPMVVPEVAAWDDLQIKNLVSEADYIVALGNTILDVNVARILKVAEDRGVRHFRYHSTAVEGARHFLQSLAHEGLI